MAPASTPTTDTAKRPANQGVKNRSPTRASTPSSPGPSNVARTKSVRTTINGSSMTTAKSAARKPGAPTRGDSSSASEESKASNTALVDDLKEQLRKAEAASEEYQKQAYVLQTKLDEALSDHAKAEETSQEQFDMIGSLHKEKQDATRRNRELQTTLEADRAATLREKEEAAMREEELTEVVQRMKESMAQREQRRSLDGESLLSGSANLRGRSSPRLGTESPASQGRDGSQNNSKLLTQKDKVIESLRLELAEAQIKTMESESAGGGRIQELEKKLLEVRMNNAKVMEDNESYQVLLSEKTLNGDFSKSNIFDSSNSYTDRSESSRTPTRDPSSSLADELDTADIETSDDPHTRKLESDLSAARDQNKALTLYINKIIFRLLQSEQFETFFADGSLTGEGLAKSTKAKGDEPVDLRGVSIPEEGTVTPPTMGPPTIHASPAKESIAPSLLQRAGSLFGGRQRPRPRSLNPAVANTTHDIPQSNPANIPLPPTPGATNGFLTAPNQDPATAPSLLLRRSHSGRGGSRSTTMRTHRRATSEWSPTTGMYRGAPSGALSPQSPAGMLSPRAAPSSLASLQSAPPPLILEDSETREPESLMVNRSEAASDSGYGESIGGSIDPPGSPRSAAAAALEGKAPHPQRSDTSDSKASASGMAAGAASWFTGSNKPSAGMRPLRLVQDKVTADEAAKKANRSSFMGWFNKAGQGQAGPPVLGSSPPAQSTLGIASPPPMKRKVSSESRPSTGGVQEES